jgi:hypothetical protein
MVKNILIYTHVSNFSFEDGGTVVQYYLAQILEEYGHMVRIYPSSGIKTPNHIFSKFYNNDFPKDDNTVVIYCEGTHGNPLNAKNVVRWMLSELGQNVPYDWVNTWGKNELVYYFNSELKFGKNPEKVGNIYKLLSIIYVNPLATIINNNERSGTCFTYRKTHVHKIGIRNVHPPGSFEINRGHTQSQCIDFFNKYKVFISYDPLTFLSIISALCGCISIIYKIDGLNKKEWLNTSVVAEYLQYSGEELYGIAYGANDIQHAIDTLHLVKQQWNNIQKYTQEKTVLPFIEDMQNIEKMENTIQNNYFI